MLTTKERFQVVQARILAAAKECGRSPMDVGLVAVSKFKTVDEILVLQGLGHKIFGENYVDELVEKAKALAHTSIHWAFIGQLQSNKIAKMLPWVHEIQTLILERHAERISKCLEEQNRDHFPVYIQVNLDPLDPRQGLRADEALAFSKRILSQYPRLSLQGIMSIPTESVSEAASRPGHVPELFLELAVLAKKIGLGKLSLGMSQDLEAAVSAGSTCIRVGTAIFGERIRKS
jgi:pyridoxal phosphate enzyme (YggS family)